jgi:sec-independent protein translocase protein TatB
MFDVGFWEILLILILALVVIGPERLPSAARKAGYFVGKARRYIEGVRSEVESELDVNEFKRMLHNQEVQINELQEQVKSGVNDVKSDVSDATSAAIDDTETYSFHDELPEDVDALADTSAKTDSSSNKENA